MRAKIWDIRRVMGRAVAGRAGIRAMTKYATKGILSVVKRVKMSGGKRDLAKDGMKERTAAGKRVRTRLAV